MNPRSIARGTLVLAVVACGPTAPVQGGSDTAAAATTDDDPPSTSASQSPSQSASQSDEGPDDPRWDLPPSVDESGEDTGPDAIDCIDFDPARVYLRGTLEQGATYLDALTDPTDPTIYCVGFGDSSGFMQIRGADRRVVFVDEYDGGGVLEFSPDMFGMNPNGSLIYPDDPYANDALLMPSPCNGDGLGPILLSPVDGRAWFSCGGLWFDPDALLAWGYDDGYAVAVAPDGRLLVNDRASGSDLYLVTPLERPELALELPRDVEVVVTGRVHDGGLWLVALAGTRMFRWHLVGEAIVEEGEYSDADVDIAFAGVYDGVIDGAGDYFHLATAPGDQTNDVIVRRRLAPDPSEIIYAEADAPTNGVKIYLSELFTGP